ncbi:adhesion G-protein coupled receptor G7-like [Antedon mediterranea]|uniref:adhesion G-protein coupled receptor G7-like n=1 Tax=Antedon mediterranea TaxID=105859 RepID=UPI003AF9DC8A
MDDNDGSITCNCTHLTNFAVLFFDNDLADTFELFLDILTYVGCVMSILCLLVTIVVSLSIKTLRKRQPQKILLNLSISLTCLYLTFICGIDTATPETVACTTIAVLLHYFLLTSVAWTSMEAVNMYLLFVKVFNAKSSKFLWFSMVFAWGIPCIPPIVLLTVDVSFYENKYYCYLNTMEFDVFIYAVLIPIAIAIFFNSIIFVLVLKSLYCSRSNAMLNKNATLEEKKKRVFNAIAISFLLGLTWVFGFLSFESKADHVFVILFCVFNSFQGVAIFYLFTFRQKEFKDLKKRNTKRYLPQKLSNYSHRPANSNNSVLSNSTLPKITPQKNRFTASSFTADVENPAFESSEEDNDHKDSYSVERCHISTPASV